MAGAQNIEVKRGLRINASATVLQAVIAGRGVALGRSVLVASDLADGTLIRPFAAPALPLAQGWYLVSSPDAASSARVAAFREWMVTQTSPWTAS